MEGSLGNKLRWFFLFLPSSLLFHSYPHPAPFCLPPSFLLSFFSPLPPSPPFFHLPPPLEVVVSRLVANGPRRCSREAGGEGPQVTDAGAAFGAREPSPGRRVNEKRTSPLLGNYHCSALREQLHSPFFLNEPYLCVSVKS